jgi:hypothetical protein
MKKLGITLVSIFMLLAFQNANAQTFQSNRSIQISYGFVGGEIAPGTPAIKEMKIHSSNMLMVNANLLELSPKLVGGFHLGIGMVGYESIYDEGISNTVGIHYGIDLQYSILPFNGDGFKRWDVLLKTSLGSYFNPYQTMQVEYGLGVAVEYYPISHLGIFVESSWGRYKYGDYNISLLGEGNTMIKAGVSYRL